MIVLNIWKHLMKINLNGNFQYHKKKCIQNWLVENMYNPDIINPGDFKYLLNYLQNIQGSAREVNLKKRIKNEAIEIVNNNSKAILTGYQLKINDDEIKAKHKERKIKRADKIAQLLA